ncbi:MAG: hypothetical protein HKO92_03585 [Flavobacteriaceae bacterium]|nr:hypothetical protein [Flavobacteriaceae bacterium]
MIKKLIIVLFALLACNIQAQEGTTSPYSFYGIGSLNFKGTVENKSMGGISVYTDSIHVNLRNPASFTGNNLKISGFDNESRPVKFAVGGQLSSGTLKTNSQEAEVGTTTFDYLVLSIPLGKFGVGFGLLPYTSVGYKLESSILLNDEEKLKNRYRGEGGVNKTFLSLGYQFTEELSGGIDASYNFGNIINNAVEYSYDNEGNLLTYQTRETNRSDLSGLNFNLGISYKPMLSDKLQLSTAFTYAPKSELASANERVFSTIVINSLTGEEFAINELEADLESQGLKETDLTLPSKTTFGLGIGQPYKWFVGADYTLLKTSQYSNPIFTNNSNANFEDSSTFALGGFFIPEYSSFNKYLKRVVYRAGVHYGNTGLKINDESINEFGISFGVGLPVGRVFSNVNLGLELGQRGTTKANLVKENFLNFQLSLSLNDRWFVKRKYN